MVKPSNDCTDCLRGIPNDDYIFGNTVDWTLFNPDTLQEPTGWEGSSVNWVLDDGALDQLFNQLKRDQKTFQFKSGAVRIPREKIDALIGRFGDHLIEYELRPENDNDYHGHLLFSTTLDKKRKATLCGALAMAVSEIHARE